MRLMGITFCNKDVKCANYYRSIVWSIENTVQIPIQRVTSWWESFWYTFLISNVWHQWNKSKSLDCRTKLDLRNKNEALLKMRTSPAYLKLFYYQSKQINKFLYKLSVRL